MYHIVVKNILRRGSHPGGALTLERGMGMCRGHDPLFLGQSPLPSPPIYPQFTVNVPLSYPLFSIFRKFLHFQPCFGQNSSSLDLNFWKFRSQDPHFLRKIRSLDPTFWNPRGTRPPKKSWMPPGGPISQKLRENSRWVSPGQKPLNMGHNVFKHILFFEGENP